MKITVILPPWLPGRAERDALVRAAARLDRGAACEVLEFNGRATAEALAARAASLLDRASPQLVLIPTGTEGEQTAALIASALQGRTLGSCSGIEVEGDGVLARRPVFGGRAELVLRSGSAITCATLRGVAGDPVDTPPPRVIEIDEPAALESEPVASTAKFPRVEGAGIVVSGGRGVGAPEGFELLARIAGTLGAGLGGSLPAVDAGWVPVAHQVGQSGKFVTPRVYFAVAISGTPQHLAGVSPDARIVALNADRDAPIFGRCDVGVLGDWRELLPLLAEELELLRPEA